MKKTEITSKRYGNSATRYFEDYRSKDDEHILKIVAQLLLDPVS